VIQTSITLSPADGRIRAQLFKLGAVIGETTCEDGSIEMHLRIEESSLRKITQEKQAATYG